MFVDDTAIYAASKSVTELELLMQDKLYSLSQWLIYNRHSITVKKSKVMSTVTTQHLRQTKPLNLYINNTKIEQVDEYLYLGVLLDAGLKLILHVEMTFDESVRKLGLICKT